MVSFEIKELYEVPNLALSWEGWVVSETGEQEYYRQLGGMNKS